MAFLFKCDMSLFQNWNLKLAKFGEHFGSAVPRKTKDPIVLQMLIEGRLHAFWSASTALYEFLKAAYKDSDLKKKTDVEEDPIRAVLLAMLESKMIATEDLFALIEIIEFGKLLAFDKAWLNKPEARQFFEDSTQKLPRYYHHMSTLSGMLTQRLTVVPKEAHARQ